jgi:hypothetical protein
LRVANGEADIETTPLQHRQIARATDLPSPYSPCIILRSTRIAEHSAHTLPRTSRRSWAECAPFP